LSKYKSFVKKFINSLDYQFMTQLAPICLDDGTVIYVEATEDVNAPPVSIEELAEEESLSDKGGDITQIIQNFQAIQSTIRAYTTYTLNAFKQVKIADVNKVTLEFGIQIGGETGIPYVTKGTAQSNLKITVECSFPDRPEPNP
jgi:hypothetical protein